MKRLKLANKTKEEKKSTILYVDALMCEYCETVDDTVVACANPYHSDIYNDDTLHNICTKCYNEFVDDI